ncbi:prolyl oligopeptidase family serine peptidase [candidate division WOR-3 bacterium]|nr:prolyl oligopeptidase family serine peptidase [candidate division WOR-3 bacterium]
MLHVSIAVMPKAQIAEISMSPEFSAYGVERLSVTAIYPELRPEKMPVVVILPGFDGNAQWYLQYLNIEKILVQSWLVEPFITVIVDPISEPYSCCYVNSELSGKWEDIISEYLPARIDEWARDSLSIETGQYCLVGHSLGGFGALYIGSRHPDIFKCVGSISGILTLESIHAWTEYIKREGVWRNIDLWTQEHFFTRLSYQLCANFLSMPNPQLFVNDGGNLQIDGSLIALMKDRGFDVLSWFKEGSAAFSDQKVFIASAKGDIVCPVRYHQDLKNNLPSADSFILKIETYEGDHISILGESILDCFIFFFEGED